jgi:hypothetical protein
VAVDRVCQVIRGNIEGWKIHMMGLKQMVDMRGGITEFSVGLQLKLHRSVLCESTNGAGALT